MWAAIGATILASLIWGASNRGRGWGPILPAPKWQVTLSKILSRDTMALAHGAVVWAWFEVLGYPTSEGLIVAALVTVFWRVAVSPGWGEYQDLSKFPNAPERPWIDWFVTKVIVPAMLKVERLAPLTKLPRVMDPICMALRGLWYVPIYISVGIYLESWWMLLPAAFFWQDAIVYRAAHRLHLRGKIWDYVALCEWVNDIIRALLFFAALWLTYHNQYSLAFAGQFVADLGGSLYQPSTLERLL